MTVSRGSSAARLHGAGQSYAVPSATLLLIMDGRFEQSKYKADMKFVFGVIALVSLAVALVAYYLDV
jgi:hypothetical protein